MTTNNAINNIQFSVINEQIFTSSGTYTPTAGMLYCIVELIGGGGGGGGCGATSSTQFSNSVGGGAGEYARGVFSSSTVGASQTVTIGAGGTAGAVGVNPGGTGGTSSFGSLMTAVGGNGGPGGPAFTNYLTFNGVVGGTGGTGGSFRSQGGSSTVAAGFINFNGSIVISIGGASVYSGQAIPPESNQFVAVPGSSYGGGASGGANELSAPDKGGAAGADGICIITEYIA